MYCTLIAPRLTKHQLTVQLLSCQLAFRPKLRHVLFAGARSYTGERTLVMTCPSVQWGLTDIVSEARDFPDRQSW